jgi:hypothetical protein
MPLATLSPTLSLTRALVQGAAKRVQRIIAGTPGVAVVRVRWSGSMLELDAQSSLATVHAVLEASAACPLASLTAAVSVEHLLRALEATAAEAVTLVWEEQHLVVRLPTGSDIRLHHCEWQGWDLLRLPTAVARVAAASVVADLPHLLRATDRAGGSMALAGVQMEPAASGDTPTLCLVATDGKYLLRREMPVEWLAEPQSLLWGSVVQRLLSEASADEQLTIGANGNQQSFSLRGGAVAWDLVCRGLDARYPATASALAVPADAPAISCTWEALDEALAVVLVAREGSSAVVLSPLSAGLVSLRLLHHAACADSAACCPAQVDAAVTRFACNAQYLQMALAGTFGRDAAASEPLRLVRASGRTLLISRQGVALVMDISLPTV